MTFCFKRFPNLDVGFALRLEFCIKTWVVHFQRCGWVFLLGISQTKNQDSFGNSVNLEWNTRNCKHKETVIKIKIINSITPIQLPSQICTLKCHVITINRKLNGKKLQRLTIQYWHNLLCNSMLASVTYHAIIMNIDYGKYPQFIQVPMLIK